MVSPNTSNYRLSKQSIACVKLLLVTDLTALQSRIRITRRDQGNTPFFNMNVMTSIARQSFDSNSFAPL